jgi:hypothetical protein
MQTVAETVVNSDSLWRTLYKGGDIKVALQT